MQMIPQVTMTASCNADQRHVPTNAVGAPAIISKSEPQISRNYTGITTTERCSVSSGCVLPAIMVLQWICEASRHYARRHVSEIRMGQSAPAAAEAGHGTVQVGARWFGRWLGERCCAARAW
jgi:hypothetical protein